MALVDPVSVLELAAESALHSELESVMACMALAELMLASELVMALAMVSTLELVPEFRLS